MPAVKLTLMRAWLILPLLMMRARLILLLPLMRARLLLLLPLMMQLRIYRQIQRKRIHILPPALAAGV